MKYLLSIIILSAAIVASAQSYNSKQDLTIDVSQFKEVHIYNKHGKVKVEAVQGSIAKIQSNRKLKAKSSKKLEASKSMIYIDTIVLEDILVIYIKNPFYYLDREYDDEFMHYRTKDEGSWFNNRNKNHVKFTFDMNISMPASTNLFIATHSGDLSVEGVRGSLAARNHHDDIALIDVSEVYYVHTHHGDIDVQLEKPISRDIKLDTHHGDIKVSTPGVPSAQISFDSHHGEFYTDFDWTTISTPQMSQSTSDRSKYRTKYKLGDITSVKMGDGEYTLTFDTHHGDMYLLQL